MAGNADALTDGLGFVSGSFCPHYTSEPKRRPNYLEMVASGRLPDGYACEDGAAVHFIDTQLHTAVSVDGDAGAFRVVRAGNRALEEALESTTPS